MPKLDERAAHGLALKLLARREHSRSELVAKLRSKGARDSVIFDLLDKLSAASLQSDERFCESYVHARSARGFGPRRIRGELRDRGLSEQYSTQALQSCELNWQSIANAARTKKFGHNVPAETKERLRQMRYLEYRGFTHDQIQSAFVPAERDDC